jgi:hypothetical protein
VLVLVADYRLYPRRAIRLLEDWPGRRVGIEHVRSAATRGASSSWGTAPAATTRCCADLRSSPPSDMHPPSRRLDGLAGPYEFLPIRPDSPARPVFFHPDYPAGTQPPTTAPRSPKAFSPRRATTGREPTRSTLAMAKKLGDAGVPVELKVYDG